MGNPSRCSLRLLLRVSGVGGGRPLTSPELVEGLHFGLKRPMSFWAYMLHCNGGKLYAGHTDNLEARNWQHETGAIPGFTRNHLPVRLVWSQEFPTRDEAKAAERQIKGWSRAKKLALIRGDWGEISRLAKGKAALRQAQGERI